MASTAEAAAPPSWKSPVPYLFCGLAAMLGLIAFALLVLGCSYWKLNNDHRQRRSVVESQTGEKEAAVVVEEKYLVIMAGEDNPTFLATPCTKTSQQNIHIH
ncbi:protein GLUTAMINE DUMPER 5-like [Salvia hispanica]|uniref:protein GLUTAMINE DUMPER 5-like n=1 Tax=Salvia hispanica TaxID=49212 RepID=UPI0020095DB6|nr:protein GLUTAMINE DUMPER 5-like [Salvia hispanica]